MPVISTVPEETEYDVIIAGGGAASCVLAGRLIRALSETSNPPSSPPLTILVIESGSNNHNNPLVITPGKVLGNFAPETGLMAYYVSEVDEVGTLGRTIVTPTGRGLGGGSSTNIMMYTRGSGSDYDDWNTEGWAAKDIIPLMKKVENYQHARDTNPDAEVHGFSGPIEISQGGETNLEAALEYLKVVEEMGFRVTNDVQNLREVNAYQRWAKYISPKTGRRQDAAHAFIHPHGANPNLTVLCEHNVMRVLISDDGTAVGVEIASSTPPPAGESLPTYTFKARRKVVLSAGALGSPQILERSGVGNPTLLEALGIKCVVPLPGVGENYQDHPLLGAVNRFDKTTCPTFWAYNFAGDEEILKKADEDFLVGKGDHVANFVDAGGKVRPSEEVVKGMGREFGEVWERTYKGKEDKPLLVSFLFSTLLAPIPGLTPDHSYATNLMFLCHPASRGGIHITSPTLHTPPIFKNAILSHPADIAPFIWGYKCAREISRRMPSFRGEVLAAQPAFPETSPARCIEFMPEDGVEGVERLGIKMWDVEYTEEDDRAIELWVRGSIGTTFHSMGTCAMKKREEGGVVDGRLNVYGVKGLMVADLSICPGNVAANTYNTALIVGEKAAVLLAEELGIELL